MAGLLGLWWDGVPAQGGIACRVRIFRHISEPRGGLQSQTGDGAARAEEGPEHGLFRGRVGFARQNQGVSGAGRMLMRGISTRRVSKPPRRAARMSFSAPVGGRTFDGDKRMYNLAER